MPKGTSGAVSPLGSGATVLGALAVGAFGALFGGLAMVAVGLVAGVAGSLVDTLIGASVQARFACATCGATAEDALHCGAPTTPSTGWRWVDNDMVNACANTAGMITGLVIFAIWAR